MAQARQTRRARSTGHQRYDDFHATLWHIDDRDGAGTPDGWGVNVSASTWIDEMWLPFLRAGWADDGGSLLEVSVSAGFGFVTVDPVDQLIVVEWLRQTT